MRGTASLCDYLFPSVHYLKRWKQKVEYGHQLEKGVCQQNVSRLLARRRTVCCKQQSSAGWTYVPSSSSSKSAIAQEPTFSVTERSRMVWKDCTAIVLTACDRCVCANCFSRCCCCWDSPWDDLIWRLACRRNILPVLNDIVIDWGRGRKVD